MLESALSKLMHAPTSHLRTRASTGDDAGELASALRLLFNLKEIHVEEASDNRAEGHSSDEGAAEHGEDDLCRTDAYP